MITLIEEEQVLARINDVSLMLNMLYSKNKETGEHVSVLCVLDGAIWFTGQILTKLDFPLELGTVTYKRYQGKTGTDSAKYYPPSIDVENRDVLILDDIYDEGITIEAVKLMCTSKGARDVKSCVLLNKMKPNRKENPDFMCCTVPDYFVCGSGLDVDGLYRNLPGIKVN